MLMHAQLVPLALLSHPLPLHDVLAQDFGDALRVLERLRGFDGAGCQGLGGGEGGSGVGAGGEEGGLVVWRGC